MNMSKTVEEWRDIEGYEGLYQVSDWGRVRSLNYHRQGVTKIMKPQLRCGYYRIQLKKDKVSSNKSIHKLVAKAFIPNIENKPIIDHIDGNSKNNVAWNLRWCTQLENNNFEIHINNLSKGQKGRKHSSDSIEKKRKSLYKNIDQISSIDGEIIASYNGAKNAAKSTNTNYQTLSNCCNGRCKTANGFIWKYWS